MAEPWGHLLIGDGEPEAIRSWIVSPGFFDALGAQPLLGRIFVPEEYQAGSSPVVVVGYQWWQRHFGGDPNLVGKKLMFNNQLTVVVGVMPPDFEYPPGREVWAPRPRRENDLLNRGRTFIWVVGRLRSGRTVGQAQQEMAPSAPALPHSTLKPTPVLASSWCHYGSSFSEKCAWACWCCSARLAWSS